MPDKNEKYYRILDLEPGVSKEEVKKAFRELSHIWHPDNHMGKPKNVQNKANEKFKEISEAYQCINDLLDKENSSSKKDNYENESASRAKQRREEEEKQKRKDNQEKESQEEERNKRRQREEENRKKAEQARKGREEKERKKWEEQARKRHEEEKNNRKKEPREEKINYWYVWSWVLSGLFFAYVLIHVYIYLLYLKFL